ncbi:ribosome maturation factor RimP [Succinispira mobilis]|uniref:ribosome maturation factor RimP n=1 Tax=Succinispira mobilis TaxID=78120 RepID=UPI00048F8FF5|nr:ribosome maturation factor RimP [Succinispira mobilis]
MKREQIEQFIEEFVQEKIKNTELELVDVEYVRERDWFLRVYLDKEGGLEIEDCQYISELLTEYLDVKDPIKDKYYLEVSSPGLDRQLKKARDFVRHKGQKIDIMFFKPQAGIKKLVGILGDVNEEFLEVQTEDKTEKLSRSLIASVRLHIDF